MRTVAIAKWRITKHWEDIEKYPQHNTQANQQWFPLQHQETACREKMKAIQEYKSRKYNCFWRWPRLSSHRNGRICCLAVPVLNKHKIWPFHVEVVRKADNFYNRQLLKRINYTKHVERHLFKFTPRVVCMGARLFWFACNKNVIALLYFRAFN